MNEPLDYVGVRPCGCLVIWACGRVTDQRGRDELAKDVAKIIKRGMELKRVTTAEAKAMTMGCQLCKPVKQGELAGQ